MYDNFDDFDLTITCEEFYYEDGAYWEYEQDYEEF